MDNRESKALDEASRERRNLARDAIVIVLTGVVLGVAFNQLQMSVALDMAREMGLRDPDITQRARDYIRAHQPQ